MISLQAGAGAIITDCSAVQEETTGLGVPCYSLGSFSERPLTLTHGTNILLGDDLDALADIRLLDAPPVACAIPMWDGRAAQRIAEDLVANYAVQVSGPSLSLR